MRTPAVTTVDFETMPIRPRPEYPPVPVGVSVLMPNERKAHYYAWGHPTKNNCTKRDAARVLRDVWHSETPLLFHHAKFDIAVAEAHFDLDPPQVDRIHDTMFLLFLHDPHAADLALKPSAERLLGEPPEERDRLREWILANRSRVPFKFTPKEWGSAIAYAPGDLTGEYANGDCTRTRGLFKHLFPIIVERGMLNAYLRERKLLPILLENERVGIRVDEPALRADTALYDAALAQADLWLRKRLKVSNLNLDNDGELAAALASQQVISDEAWTLTATGRRSVSKTNLTPDMFNDVRVAQVLGYRNRLTTCLKMFMHPWLRQVDARGEPFVSTNWNQVRGTGGGTRTGRPSSSDPNFFNISKSWDRNDDGYVHPGFLRYLLALPLVRKYLLPDRGETWCHRDYNGQELRIFGHYEDGSLMRDYNANPRLDVHDHVRQLIEDITGNVFARRQVKVANFRRIYGGGVPATAAGLGCSLAEAAHLLDAHGRALPGLRTLTNQIKSMAAAGEPIVTWGGREYYCEPPGYSKKHDRVMNKDYKLLNYLVQGSAAEVTKEAMIAYHAHPKRRGRFLVAVYDEMNISARNVRNEMKVLGECMEDIEMDVPMLTDGKTGLNWAELEEYHGR
jgi:DNA polymerase I-like protein with 3'-5' exonuclease and polymerase domains